MPTARNATKITRINFVALAIVCFTLVGCGTMVGSRSCATADQCTDARLGGTMRNSQGDTSNAGMHDAYLVYRLPHSRIELAFTPPTATAPNAFAVSAVTIPARDDNETFRLYHNRSYAAADSFAFRVKNGLLASTDNTSDVQVTSVTDLVQAVLGTDDDGGADNSSDTSTGTNAATEAALAGLFAEVDHMRIASMTGWQDAMLEFQAERAAATTTPAAGRVAVSTDFVPFANATRCDVGQVRALPATPNDGTPSGLPATGYCRMPVGREVTTYRDACSSTPLPGAFAVSTCKNNTRTYKVRGAHWVHAVLVPEPGSEPPSALTDRHADNDMADPADNDMANVVYFRTSFRFDTVVSLHLCSDQAGTACEPLAPDVFPVGQRYFSPMVIDTEHTYSVAIPRGFGGDWTTDLAFEDGVLVGVTATRSSGLVDSVTSILALIGLAEVTD